MSNHLDIEVREKTLYLISEFKAVHLAGYPEVIPDGQTLIVVTNDTDSGWVEYFTELGDFTASGNQEFLLLKSEIVESMVGSLPIR